jgi:hypothetical protein
VKELEFNPNQFQILTTKIKDRKIERDFLYKKVKEEDSIYSSVMQEQQKDINIKMSESTNIHTKVRQLEEKIHNIERLMAQEDKSFKEQEYKFKQKISREENYLDDAVSDKNITQREYIAIEMEHDNILSLTQEKYNISERSLKKTSNTLIRMNEDFTKKSEELHKLMSIRFTRNIKKRNTSIKKSTLFSRSKSIVSLPKSQKTIKLNSPPLLSKKKEENKESSLFNIKENDEIKEEEKKSKKNSNKAKNKINLEDKNKYKNNKNNDDKFKGLSKA